MRIDSATLAGAAQIMSASALAAQTDWLNALPYMMFTDTAGKPSMRASTRVPTVG